MQATETGRYFDRVQPWFDRFYTDRESLSMHYGFWDIAGDRVGAMINQYRAVSHAIDPQPGNWILDAGCGVGGAALWMAERFPVHVNGITISERQVRQAKKHARRRGLDQTVVFQRRNYADTGFSGHCFDAAFGIESFCYSYPDQTELFREMHRILKPNGRLVISDGVIKRQPQNQYERALLEDFVAGFGLQAMVEADRVLQTLDRCQFEIVQVIDKSGAIERSTVDIERCFSRSRPWYWLAGKLHMLSPEEQVSVRAARSQRALYDCGIFGYSFISAVRKPE